MQHNKVGELRLFKVFGRFSIALLILASIVTAGTFEDFKRTQTESFQKYKDEKDNEFAKYLKSEWNAYTVEQSTEMYEDTKPREISPATSKKIKSVGPIVAVKVKEINEVNKVQRFLQKDINFDFFGSKLGFNIPNGIKKGKFYPLNQKGISNFFDSAATSEYEYLIEDINRVRKDMNLNDWATYLLVLQISDNIFLNQDESKLLSWFIFNKLGYAVKVGLEDRHVELIFYSKKVIYSAPNYTFGKNKFYVLSTYVQGGSGKLYCYAQNYPDSDKEFDLSLTEIPNLPLDIKSKILSFKEFGITYTVPFEYNQNLIDFMATYPQADYETYFNAPLDGKTYLGIATALKKHIDGKKASDAINFVLHFVQNAFKYERDKEQFGREKVMFAEETLYFDKSDCEDRAILFAYLVRELFSVSVIGVKYKDHMATALYIPMTGDSVKDGSRKFVIADPTYVNSSIGQSMPKYKSKIPESFIEINKN